VKLYNVEISWEIPVLAENEQEAIKDAIYNIHDYKEEPTLDFVKEIKERSDLPYGCENKCPYGLTDDEELEGTCGEIISRREKAKAEEDRKRKLWEEQDKKQLKFDFMMGVTV